MTAITEWNPKSPESPRGMLFRNRWIALFAAIGLALAVLIALLPWISFGGPLFTVCFAGGIALALAFVDSNEEDRPFAARLLLLALGIHLAVVCLFWWLDNGQLSYWLKDSRTYDIVGWAWAQAWHAGTTAPVGLGTLAWVANDTFPQLVGGLYFLLGHSPLSVLFLQSVLGASSVYLTYRLSSLLLGPVTARFSGWIMIGYTGFLLFSIMILKDAAILFLILFSFYAWLRIVKILNQAAPRVQKMLPLLFWALLGAAAIMGIDSLRDYTALIVLGGWALGVCHQIVRHSGRWKWAAFFAITLAVLLAAWWTAPSILGKALPPILISPDSTLLSIAHPPPTSTIGALIQGIATAPLPFLLYLFSASASTLIAPFAWIFPGMVPGTSDWSAYYIAYPGMWLWYVLLPFSFLGCISALRRTRGDALPVIFFAVAMFLLVALLIPREVRHRDMMMPFALILAAEGVMHRRRWIWWGLCIWLPLTGFMAWKLGALIPFLLLLFIAAVVFLAVLARRQRHQRKNAIGEAA